MNNLIQDAIFGLFLSNGNNHILGNLLEYSPNFEKQKNSLGTTLVAWQIRSMNCSRPPKYDRITLSPRFLIFKRGLIFFNFALSSSSKNPQQSPLITSCRIAISQVTVDISADASIGSGSLFAVNCFHCFSVFEMQCRVEVSSTVMNRCKKF